MPADAVYNFTRKPSGAENPGLSAFALDGGVVYHTCSRYARGLDAFNATFQLLDRAPGAATRTNCPCRWRGCAATTSTST